MPVGIINVYHEPPTFNGVDRPEVDTLVIPSTWREPGFGIFGELATGRRLPAVSGQRPQRERLHRRERPSPTGHQEGMLAAARDFGAVGRLTYEPMLATIFGLSGYFATSGNSLRATVGNVPVGLVEIDARTRHRGFTARAEFAMLFIGDTAALNQALARRRADADRVAAGREAQPGRLPRSGLRPAALARARHRAERDAVQPLRLRQHAGQRRRRPHARRGVPPLRLHGRPRLPPDPADRASRATTAATSSAPAPATTSWPPRSPGCSDAPHEGLRAAASRSSVGRGAGLQSSIARAAGRSARGRRRRAPLSRDAFRAVLRRERRQRLQPAARLGRSGAGCPGDDRGGAHRIRSRASR